VAGVGTVLLLPGRREKAVRKIGGVVVLTALLIFVGILVRGAAAQTGGGVYFWIFSGIAIVSAVRVISHAKAVYCALYLVLSVVASAGLFVLLWAEFMAAAFILVYAGAIVVTYVFVIMLAYQGRSGEGAEYDRVSHEPAFASAVGFALMGIMLFLIFEKGPGLDSAASGQGDEGAGRSAVRELGRYLFHEQLIAVEVAGVLLMMSVVGAVCIVRRSVAGEAPTEEIVAGPGRPVSDDPHSIPVYGTKDPQGKAYPEG
jgi:NADH-quinone oxidoreductase subunit J